MRRKRRQRGGSSSALDKLLVRNRAGRCTGTFQPYSEQTVVVLRGLRFIWSNACAWYELPPY